MARPVLKWAGGKRRLRFEIDKLLPPGHNERNYHEPFFGGGALFFHLEPMGGSINDVNERLIRFYKVVRERPEDLIEEVNRYEYGKEQYYELRARFNEEELGPVEEAAIFLYLNKSGYNGLYRVNSKNKFNVPFGRYKNPTIAHPDRIMKASILFSRFQIYCDRFTYVKTAAAEGDLVYLDPPYLPKSDTADFTAYSKLGFGLEDHMLLRDLCLELDENGVHFIQSNSFVEPIMEAYKDTEFNIHTVEVSRAINRVITDRGRIPEVLITNIPKV
jgi:DNA adenine methylase